MDIGVALCDKRQGKRALECGSLLPICGASLLAAVAFDSGPCTRPASWLARRRQQAAALQSAHPKEKQRAIGIPHARLHP